MKIVCTQKEKDYLLNSIKHASHYNGPNTYFKRPVCEYFTCYNYWKNSIKWEIIEPNHSAPKTVDADQLRPAVEALRESLDGLLRAIDGC